MALIAVLTLALGIGAPVAVLAFLEALTPPPLRGPYASHTEQLVRVQGVRAYRAYVYARDRVRALSMSVTTPTTVYLGTSHNAPPVVLECVSATYLELLEAQPQLGRPFTVLDDTEGAAPVLLLAHRTWQLLFEEQSDVIGSSLHLDGRLYTVIGVMPPDYRGVANPATDAWTLLAASPEQCMGVDSAHDWQADRLTTIGRLREPFSVAAALQEVASHGDALAGLNPDYHDDSSPAVVPWHNPNRQSPRSQIMRWAGVSAAAVSLLACVTIALLLFLGVLQRRVDIAVRMQIGARRSWIFVKLLTEAAFLGAACVPPALVVAVLLAAAMEAVIPLDSTDRLLTPRWLAAVAGLVMGAGCLGGVLPALVGSWVRLNAVRATGANARTKRQTLALDVLLASQIASALVLVTLAGVFVRSAMVASRGTGYDVDHLIVVNPARDVLFWRDPAAGSAQDRALRAARERLRGSPAVRELALSSQRIPLQPSTSTAMRTASGTWASTFKTNVSPGYFAAVGTRIVEGRAFAAADAAGDPPVAIVSEELAARLWPEAGALGECLYDGRVCHAVIGISESGFQWSDFTFMGLLNQGEAFFPLPQNARPQRRTDDDPFPLLVSALIVRTQTPTRDTIATIAAAVRNVPGTPAVDYPRLLVRRLADLAPEEMRALLLAAAACGLFGVLAVMLTMVGVYGAMVTAMRHRIPELGIHMALGAGPATVAWLVARRGVRVLIAGLAVGGVGLVIAAPVIASSVTETVVLPPGLMPAAPGLVLGVLPLDWTAALIGTCVTTVSVVASLGFVAAKACRVSPAVAGREVVA